MKNHITAESFGDTLPANWEEIVDYLNDIIDERGLETVSEVNELWEQYCNGELPDAPEAEEPKPALWYAIMMDEDDSDWGTGTYDKSEAIERVKALRENHPNAYIAVIEESDNPVCVDTIDEF